MGQAKEYTPLAPENVVYKTNVISEMSTIDPETGLPEKKVQPYGYVEFVLPNVSTDGTPLEFSGLSYRVLFDNEPYIFQYVPATDDHSAYYWKLEGQAPMEWVAETFTESWDFTTYSKDDKNEATRHRIYIYGMGHDTKTAGVQSRYKRGTKYYESTITEVTPIIPPEALESGVASVAEEMGDAQYFDLQGRRASADAKGILVRKATLTDGSCKVTKVIR